MSFRERDILHTLIGFLICLAPGAVSRAQQAPQTRGEINNTQIVRLEHTTHPLVRTLIDSGRVEGEKSLGRMLLVLSPPGESEAELKKLLEEQQNPNSPNYHRWVTAEEFGARFGLADTDVQAVHGWLEQAGFTVGAVARSKRWIEFSGSAQQVESAFHTQLRYFNGAGKRYLANSVDIAIPEELARVSRGLASLNNFEKRPPQKVFGGIAGRNEQGQKVRVQPNLTATGTGGNVYYLSPGDFATIYNTKPLLASGIDGTGVTIAVIGQSQIELTDVQTFRQIFQLKNNDPNIIVGGPDPGITTPTDLQEAMLDVEWAGAVAPGATIDLVIAGSTDTTNGVDLAAAYAIDNQIASILTYTYGSCEIALGPSGNAFYNALWQQAAAEGITVLVAAGDNGSAGCDSSSAGVPATQGLAVNGAASTPYNIAVGGTQFADSGNEATYWSSSNGADFSSALGYIPEAAWNESCDPQQTTSPTNCLFQTSSFALLAGAGGVSTVYTKPVWQAGAGVPADGMRDVPDVAIAAASGHDDIVYCLKSDQAACQVTGNQVTGLTLVGGTSAATPSVAGILALVEQKNGTFQGQANYTLYKLAQSNSCDSSQQTNPGTSNSCVFYDVTSGNNEVPCAGGTSGCNSTQSGVNGFMSGYPAGPGYDLGTGLGSVNAANLANAWNRATFTGSQTTLQMPTTSFAHGTAVTLSGTVAAVSGTGTPTGNVSLKTGLAGATDVLTVTNGAFTGSVKDLPGGQYQLTAHYAGDGMFGPSDSTAVMLNVTPEASTTNLSVNGLQGGSTTYGAQLPLRITVQGNSGAGIATGSVTLMDGTTTIGTYPLGPDGSAYISTGGGAGYSFAPGTHNLTATYAGDNSFNGSTSTTSSFSVAKGAPFVIIGLNSASVNAGEPLGVHAAVSGFGTAAATGTVQFTDNGTPVGPVLALQTGGLFGTQAQAATLLTLTAAGIHSIGANYDGSSDPNYSSVSSGDPNNEIKPLPTVTIGANNGTPTTTAITNATLPVMLGDNGTFTVTVSPSAATGTVSLWDAVGPRSAPVTIQSGFTTVQIQIVWPQAGSTSLYAVYSGDATYAGSASAPKPFTVNRGAPQVMLNGPASTDLSHQISLDASVTGNPMNTALPFPTGFVEFWDSLNGVAPQLLTVQGLTAGAGNISVYGLRTKLAAGTHTLKAHYRGDNNWMPADSSNLTVTVSPPSVAITTVSLPNGEVGAPYTGILAATGGATPYTWSLTSGTLPAGLSLVTSTGVITGTPTTFVTNSPLTFRVSDSSNPVLTQTVNLTLTTATDFFVVIAPDPLVITDGNSSSATVTVNSAFTGTINFACPTGTNNVPVGYSCTLNPNPLSVTAGTAATSTMTLSPVTLMAGAVHTTEAFGRHNAPWQLELAAGILLLGLMLTGVGGSKGGKGILFAAGCVLCVSSIVTGCGGGGGGPVLSTTTLSTSNNRVTFQTPITFTARVNASGNPGGTVQLYDNGAVYGNPGTLTGGTVSFLTTNLPIGIHNVKAVYSGDAHTQSSTSSTISQMVLGSVPLQITATATGGSSHTANFTLVLN